MNISSLSSTVNTYTNPSNVAHDKSSPSTGTPFRPNSNNDSVTISHTARSVSEKMQTIANKYDVTNISTAERIAMAQELSDNQLMPKGAMISMVAPLSMNEDISQKSNYLDTMRESFKFLSKMGGSAEQLELQRQSLEMLEQLNALSHN